MFDNLGYPRPHEVTRSTPQSAAACAFACCDVNGRLCRAVHVATRRRRVRLQWEFIDEANSATAELHSGHGSLIPGVSIRLASASVYLGNWRITSAVVAAWSDPARKPDAAEMKTLVGTAVVFTADAIRVPERWRVRTAVSSQGPSSRHALSRCFRRNARA